MHRRVCFIPLDSRPVCYDMPRRMARMADLELCVPSPKLLGGLSGNLKEPADFKALQRWVKNHLFENDPVIVALDTIAYGGLIPSRLGHEPLEVVEQRLDAFFKTVKASTLFGFSSVMRIPNYNSAEEEPDYWARFGKLLYQYSVEIHQNGKPDGVLADQIPPQVLEDFLARRTRNYTVNQGLVRRLAHGQLDYLTFCQDDTGPFGLNVREAASLREILGKTKTSAKSHVQTGADEVACCLLARWMGRNFKRAVSVYPIYTSESGRKLIARFDGIPIEDVVTQQIQACGATVAKKADDAELWLLVHTPDTKQGDHCEHISAKVAPEQIQRATELCSKAFHAGKPLVLADVAYTNGSDPELVSKIVTQLDDLTLLFGYAGWNTPGNTIGSALAMGLIRLLAEENNRFDATEFSKLLLIRFGDDWLYQSQVRKAIRQVTNGKPPDEGLLNAEMANGLALLQGRLGLGNAMAHCRFPCQRTFEIEIGLK